MSYVLAVGTLITIQIYDRIIVPILRQVTGNERAINILTTINVGMTLFVILIETKRLIMTTHDVL